MSEERTENAAQREQIYKCPSNKDALFCCSQKSCTQPAIKCISSYNCTSCKQNHKKCPREIKIAKIMERAQKISNAIPYKSINPKPQDLIQRLINQLEKTRKKIMDLKVEQWGLQQNFLDIAIKQALKQKQGRLIAQFVDTQPMFPSPQFYIPAQFIKDIDQMQVAIRQFQQRSFTLHDIYKELAELDCQLKFYEQKLETEANIGIKFITLEKLQKLHQRFSGAIRLRLTLDRKFFGVEQITTNQQLRDFRQIGKRIFQLNFIMLGHLIQQKLYADVLKFIDLNRELFHQNREQFRLIQDQTYRHSVEKMKQYEAIAAFQTQNYQLAFNYFKDLPDNKFNVQFLRMMVEICEKLLKNGKITDYSILLKYLLLLHAIKSDDLTLLEKIIDCYKFLDNKQKIYEYFKKINQILRNNKLSAFDFVKWLERQLYCIKLEEQRRNFIEVFKSIKDALELIYSFTPKNTEIVQKQLKLRYTAVILHRYSQSDYAGVAGTAAEACKKYYENVKKLTEGLPLQEHAKFIKILKQYWAKFLLIQAQGANKSAKEQILRDAFSLFEQLRIKVFEPVYEMAKLLYQEGSQQALIWQDRANLIYPTDLCFRQKAFLLYKQSFSIQRTEKLTQCISSIDKSLSLNPNQSDLYYLRGIAHQNLKKYAESNKDLKIAMKMGEKKIDIERRIAENNELIVKEEGNGLTVDQKNQLISQAERLYEKCLNAQPNNLKSILGYGRVSKIQKNFKRAEEYFRKLLNTEYKNQAYMYLGNMKEELGKENNDRDFNLLGEALELYLKAGRIKENKQNLVRIYQELDQPTKAEEIQKSTN